MGMHNWPAHGHLLEFNEKNMKQLGLNEEAAKVTKLIEDEQYYGIAEENDNPVVIDFITAFTDKWGITPSFIYLNDEVEGCDGGAEPETLYLYFHDDDKWVKTEKPEWTALPVKPEESSWTIFA